ncbi:hypothetical protein PPSIR1_19002 [Plesiocystis pacifica SIR-1]|uniref:Uncharacterized protein n=1 Tax=Plesiocystis pacifica SIR-1 TaxID=391625 RepID=A6GGL7_9BACT|nr:hypothetical protein [Plesiocystis pacifica]EDM74977.1 hypothetical protein PPSIR1_19002 [Plesiocystis pacifica SIR-1]
MRSQGWRWSARFDGGTVILLEERPQLQQNEISSAEMSWRHDTATPSIHVTTSAGDDTQVTGLGEVKGQVAGALPLPDGFLIALAPSREYFRGPHHAFPAEPFPVEVSRVVGT